MLLHTAHGGWVAVHAHSLADAHSFAATATAAPAAKNGSVAAGKEDGLAAKRGRQKGVAVVACECHWP